MAIQELTPEQVKTMSLEEKDRWWLENVYKGDMPQLTIRSAITGMMLGGILSLTNLYVGIRTGWTLGVGITSVILSFAAFKVLSRLGLGKEMTILENNAMQSIATSAGYMTSPMIASIPAYMMVTGQVVPMFYVIPWLICISVLGVLFAFPLKRRFINDEQLPFPEGYAAGVVLDNLHSEQGEEGFFKAKILLAGGFVAALIQMMRSEKLMTALKVHFATLPEYWDNVVYRFFTPAVFGIPLRDLTIQLDSSIVMAGTGGLMGIKAAFSLLVGGVLNYFLLAPIMINNGIIVITNPANPFKDITMWSLWGGVAMMTTASMYSFFSKPAALLQSLRGLVGVKQGRADALKDIELPMWLFVVGIPVVGIVTVAFGHLFFGIHWWLGLLGIPLVFVFTVIAVNSTGLTSITPVGAMGKLTQVTYSVLAPGNIKTNIMTAGLTAEVVSSASNLLMDIKPAYMLGGKPRHQAMGHVLGIFAGSLIAIPVFYLIFQGDLSLLGSRTMPMPSAQVWKAVAEVLTKGLGFLHVTAQMAVLVGAVLGVLFEFLNNRMNGRFPISGVGMGLAFVLPFPDTLNMFLGAFLFWYLGKRLKNPQSRGYRIFVDNRETLCAGIIAGGSIIGLLLIVLEVLVLK